MPVPIDHFNGPPAVSIHNLTHARSALQQRRRGMVPEIVEPHSRHARFLASSDKGPRDRVQIVRTLAYRVGREYVRRGSRARCRTSSAHVRSFPVSLQELRRLRTDGDATALARLGSFDLGFPRNSRN